jgi:hypothetical protein
MTTNLLDSGCLGVGPGVTVGSGIGFARATTWNARMYENKRLRALVCIDELFVVHILDDTCFIYGSECENQKGAKERSYTALQL